MDAVNKLFIFSTYFLVFSLFIVSSQQQIGEYSGTLLGNCEGNICTIGSPNCGDGTVNQGVEQCDGSDLNGETCSSLVSGSSGILSCSSQCTFDTSQCAIGNPGNPGGDSGGSSGGGGGSGSGNIVSLSNRGCIENWECTSWTNCIDGKITRECNDLNQCGTFQYMPLLSETCEEFVKLKSGNEGGFLEKLSETVFGEGNKSGLVFFGLLVFLLIAYYVVVTARKKLG
jgi:hypothetical protein